MKGFSRAVNIDNMIDFLAFRLGEPVRVCKQKHLSLSCLVVYLYFLRLKLNSRMAWELERRRERQIPTIEFGYQFLT